MPDKNKDTHIFIAYASKDEAAYDTLMSQLKVLAKEIPIKIWGRVELPPGAEIQKTTQAELRRADIVLLLVSAELLISELYINLQPKVQTSTNIVPVLLRSCVWKSDPFLKDRQPLPKDGQFISRAEDKDEIYMEIAGEIRKMISLKKIDSLSSIPKNDSVQQRILECSKIIKMNPNYVLMYNKRGMILSNELKDYDKAIIDFDKAIELNPDYIIAHYNRGITYSKSKKYEKAILDFDEVVMLNPSFYRAYYSRGIAHSRLGMYKKAISDYGEAIILNPNFMKAYVNRGTIYSNNLKQYNKAILDFDKAIELKPDFGQAYHNRAITYDRLQEYGKAMLDYEKARELGYKF